MPFNMHQFIHVKIGGMVCMFAVFTAWQALWLLPAGSTIFIPFFSTSLTRATVLKLRLANNTTNRDAKSFIETKTTDPLMNNAPYCKIPPIGANHINIGKADCNRNERYQGGWACSFIITIHLILQLGPLHNLIPMGV